MASRGFSEKFCRKHGASPFVSIFYLEPISKTPPVPRCGRGVFEMGSSRNCLWYTNRKKKCKPFHQTANFYVLHFSFISQTGSLFGAGVKYADRLIYLSMLKNLMKKIVPRHARRVMVFGTFDGLHAGHLHFLSRAKKLGSFLIVVVGRDKAVSQLKMKLPRLSEKARIAMLKTSGIPDRVVLGDAKQGCWNIIKKIKPDIIALGYDQKEIKKSLQKNLSAFDSPFIIKNITAHHGHRFHTRFLKEKSAAKRV
jgi:FAD synthetase